MRKILLIIALAALSLLMVACGTAEAPKKSEQPPAEAPSEGGESPSAGMRLAPGYYELEDGKVQAVGTLEYRDIEGGLWAVIGGTEAEGNLGEVAAVIANPDTFKAELEKLKGGTVLVTGKAAEGASIRMAGPEIEAESIEGMSDTPGIAE